MHSEAAVQRPSASRTLALKLTVIGALLASTTLPAQAGWFDSLFGKSNSQAAAPANAASKNRTWQLHEFTVIQLQPREAGTEANQHPVSVAPESLRQQLAAIQVTVNGEQEPLFGTDELSELVVPLSQALASARPADDIVLLSSDRRGGGMMAPPLALTARLFVQGGALQLIVHDARKNFYDAYRGTGADPKFTFGMRSAASGVVLSSPGAKSTRADWLSIPMNASSLRKTVEAPAPLSNAPVAAPAVPVPLGPAAPSAAAMAVPAAAAPAPMMAAPAPMPAPAAAPMPVSEVERRLETLKRLHDKGLITDEEFQEKRKEVLKSL